MQRWPGSAGASRDQEPPPGRTLNDLVRVLDRHCRRALDCRDGVVRCRHPQSLHEGEEMSSVSSLDGQMQRPGKTTDLLFDAKVFGAETEGVAQTAVGADVDE